MKNIHLIYTIFPNSQSSLLLYPPLSKEKNTEYICFTDSPKLLSNFWKIQFLPALNEEIISSFTNAYQKVTKLELNQLLIDSNDSTKYIITIPDIYTILKEKPDFSSYHPTADFEGNYSFIPNSYTKDKISTKNNYHGFPLLLTIGVPVSNQVSTIRRCLDGIKPLLQAIPSELLVIDTGSTDGTLSIAKEYTDHIISVPWDDNMSSVRNAGIQHAKGYWYMSIDDDEWFESVDEIIEFFQSGKYKDYLFATYIERNFLDTNHITYSDNLCIRLGCITPSLHFEGRIHDLLIGATSNNCYDFSAIAYHTGFIQDSSLTFQKTKRNLSLLYFDLYEYPMNLRYNYQIINEFRVLHNHEAAIAYLYRGLAINLIIKDSYWQQKFSYILLLELYHSKNSYFFTEMQNYLSHFTYTTLERTFFHYMAFDLSSELQLNSRIIRKEAASYQYYYKKCMSDKPSISSIDILTNPMYQTAYSINFFILFVKEKNFQTAQRYLTDINLTDANNLHIRRYLQCIISLDNDNTLKTKAFLLFENYIKSFSQNSLNSLCHTLFSKSNLAYHFLEYYKDTNNLSSQMNYFLYLIKETFHNEQL